MSLIMRSLGTDGPQVSAVGLGGNNFGKPGYATEDLKGTDAVIGEAIDLGINLIDTAELYNDGVSETLIGQALTGDRRDRVLIATKFGHRASGNAEWGPKGSAGYIAKAADASLQRLGVDVIDLYQMHTPDPETPIEETLEALDALVTAGKVRHIGHSNFDADLVRHADDVAIDNGWTRFVSAQNLYSLVERGGEARDFPAMAERGLGLLPYFPLASGLLTGKYRRDERPAGSRLEKRDDLMADVDWDRLDDFAALCESEGVSQVEAAIGWLIAQDPVSSVIAGATRPEQVRANAAAGERELSAEFVDQLSALFAPPPVEGEDELQESISR